MKKWLFGFLGVALIVFCSVFGYVSYQKHEGDVFKQNIEKKMPVDQINAHAKSYKEDATNVNNDMSLGQMLSIQKEAKEIIQNSRTSQPVKGLKGQKGSFEATIVLKEDFTTGFEFSEKKKTNFKKRTRRTTK
ncbi:sortase [Enterococcus faecium]|nr:sortase [Enterococcus faecium]MBK4815647.1 sortase [Enterococcus faecium]